MAKGIGKLLLALLIIAVLCYTAAFGMTIGQFRTYSVMDEEHGIRKGFDLAGGSVIVYQATTEKDTDGNVSPLNPTEQQMMVAKRILDSRLARQGFTEGIVNVKGNQLEVELPSIKDTAEAIEAIGKTAKLTFEEEPTEEGGEGNIIMTGEDVKSAQMRFEQVEQNSPAQYIVAITITDDASKRFAEATERSIGKNISIKLDTDVISAPNVKSKIETVDFIIQGDFTSQGAEELAAYINDGQLPFSLTVVQQRTAGPTLGDNALNTGLMAALIGTLIIFLFMILFYRLPGFVASIALVAYISIVALVCAWLRVNLSLPGIAGIILSIGMAVDANVLIFERMKEEFKLGKTLKASLDSGFKRALVAIIDSNITTLLAAAVLYFMGTGPIKGFAITLAIGILVSMFTAIIVTKFLLHAIVDMNIKNRFLYGAPLKGGNKNV